jgi:hypothetical protein
MVPFPGVDCDFIFDLTNIFIANHNLKKSSPMSLMVAAFWGGSSISYDFG